MDPQEMIADTPNTPTRGWSLSGRGSAFLGGAAGGKWPGLECGADPSLVIAAKKHWTVAQDISVANIRHERDGP
jgi:hypothetical protein